MIRVLPAARFLRSVPFSFVTLAGRIVLMLITDFDYDLPAELIAQQPLADRAASRMLVVDRGTNSFTDNSFRDLPSFLREGDILVLNNTKVFPARLFGRTDTGAKVEIFLVSEVDPGTWETLARPARRLSPGKRIDFGGRISAEIVDKSEDGRVTLRFEPGDELWDIIDEIGRTPLPPYIKREIGAIDSDRDRYQTVFASNRGAIAAPTAGLHFTPDILDTVRSAGVEIVEVTLHVGYGTFEPVRTEKLEEHTVSAERYAISTDAADRLRKAKEKGRRLIAIGTTTTRALESNLLQFGKFTAGSHLAGLTITPGYRFAAVNGLLTNFHLPQSSLLVLVSTFAGHELIMNSYRHAVAARYRFYSYGDCMLVI